MKAKQFRPSSPQSSGFTLAISTRQFGRYFRLGINRDAQKKVFGRLLATWEDGLLVNIFQKGLKVSLCQRGDPDALRVEPGNYDSIFVCMEPWSAVDIQRRHATELMVHKLEESSVVLRLPTWSISGPSHPSGEP